MKIRKNKGTFREYQRSCQKTYQKALTGKIIYSTPCIQTIYNRILEQSYKLTAMLFVYIAFKKVQALSKGAIVDLNVYSEILSKLF